MSPFSRSLVAGLLALALCFMLPAPARAEDDSNVNKGALIGLFVVVVGVLVWLGFRSDMDDRSFAAAPAEETVWPEDDPEAARAPAESAPVLALGDSSMALAAEGVGFVF